MGCFEALAMESLVGGVLVAQSVGVEAILLLVTVEKMILLLVETE